MPQLDETQSAIQVQDDESAELDQLVLSAVDAKRRHIVSELMVRRKTVSEIQQIMSTKGDDNPYFMLNPVSGEPYQIHEIRRDMVYLETYWKSVVAQKPEEARQEVEQLTHWIQLKIMQAIEQDPTNGVHYRNMISLLPHIAKMKGLYKTSVDIDYNLKMTIQAIQTLDDKVSQNMSEISLPKDVMALIGMDSSQSDVVDGEFEEVKTEADGEQP